MTDRYQSLFRLLQYRALKARLTSGVSVLVPAAILITACTSRAGIDTHTFSVGEENGVPTAVTAGGPKYQGELFTCERELILDTGQSEESLLYRPVQFMADETGAMYINDTGLGCVLVFDADGRYSHRIGRQGFGPGEASFWDIQLIDDGVIQLYGIKERRTTRFSTDGSLIDVTTLSPDIDLMGNDALIVLGDDRRLVLTNAGTEDAKSDRDQTRERRGAVIYGPEWEIVAEVHTPWTRVAEMVEMSLADKSWYAPAQLGYGPRPLSLYHPRHGIVLSLSAEPELRLYDHDGHPTRSIRIELDATPVTAADRERARQVLLGGAEQVDPGTRQQIELLAEALVCADEKAFWGWTEIDREGYFWLDLTLYPDTETAGMHTFMVVSPEGEYLGTTTRPARSGSSLTGGRLYILEEDSETGEVLPTVYRLEPAVPGLRYPG